VAGPPALAGPPAPVAAAQPSLYQRIGGVEALRAVVPRFLEHVAADERINYLFALSDLETLRGKLVDYLCQATGGPCRYAGRDMRAAHAQLPIAPHHFEALVEDLSKTFDEFKVPPREKGELLAALAPLRGDIVSTR
jgi:hemoglobin